MLISIEQVSYNINYICLRYTPLVLLEIRFWGTIYELKLLLKFYTVQYIQYQIYAMYRGARRGARSRVLGNRGALEIGCHISRYSSFMRVGGIELSILY